jgi:ligand-binding SRPBCC domain-containing protein
MRAFEIRREIWIPQPVDAVFEFFSRAQNLERITPPWLRFRILTPSPIAMRRGAIIEYALRLHGLPIRWQTRIEEWDPPVGFVDVQVKGPYLLWRHTHRFVPANNGTTVIDRVEYALPFGIVGGVVHHLQVRRDLERIFDYRERQTRSILG